MAKAIRILGLCLLILLVSACHQAPKKKPGLLQDPIIYEINPYQIAGDAKGRITLVEFFDYRCHACYDAYPDIQKLLQIDPQIRVIYREMPIEGPVSVYAAKVALASVEQDKYLQFHDALMQVGPELDESDVWSLAKELGLDIPSLKKDMSSPFVTAQLAQNQQLANKLAISGAPSYVVAQTSWQNGKLVVDKAVFIKGALSLAQFKQLIVELSIQGQGQ